jgi:uncharacterized protein YqjF (DUF2071 family)
VYFFSLDAASRAAVAGARLLLNLPYFSAVMQVVSRGTGVAYRSRRGGPEGPRFEAEYGPTGEVTSPLAGTLEHFLVERYCLYHQRRSGTPYAIDIHHPPWPLQPADAAMPQSSAAAGGPRQAVAAVVTAGAQPALDRTAVAVV